MARRISFDVLGLEPAFDEDAAGDAVEHLRSDRDAGRAIRSSFARMSATATLLEVGGALFRVHQTSRGNRCVLGVSGPVERSGALPGGLTESDRVLLLEARAARSGDRRAQRDGTIRAVTTGIPELDAVACVETHLADEQVAALFAGERDAVLARALSERRGLLRVRRAWTYLEIRTRGPEGRDEVQALARAVARVAAAARRLGPAAPLADLGQSAALVGYLGAALGAMGLYWVLGWARLARPWGPWPSTGALVAVSAGLVAGCIAFSVTRAMARKALRARPGAHRRAFVRALAVALVVGPVAAIALVVVNVVADRAAATAFTGTITSIYRYKSGAIADICVSRGELSHCTRLSYPGDRLPAVDDPRGFPVTLDLRPGALGLNWVERVRVVADEHAAAHP